MNNSYIFGRNSVIEYLKTENSINKAYVLKSSSGGSINQIVAKLKERGIKILFVEKKVLQEMSENQNHQGVILEVPPFNYSSIDDIFSKAADKGKDPLFLILDGIEDPHNLGAIIRTANIAGCDGVIIRKDRSADVTPTVNKISAGALNFTPIVRATNLNDIISKLKDRGVWIASADMDGEIMYNVDFKGSMAIIIGNEGVGVSKLLRKNSDFIVSIPMFGDINSLNASVSRIILYEAARQRFGR